MECSLKKGLPPDRRPSPSTKRSESDGILRKKKNPGLEAKSANQFKAINEVRDVFPLYVNVL